MNECLRSALRLARRGWAVFPLNGKIPFRDTHGHRDASLDADQIKAWWRTWPRANVGIACSSQSGPIIIDVDGPLGEREIKRLGLPTTLMASSGRPHRRHLYFAPSDDSVALRRTIKVRPELDILGDGGYVIAPPSLRTNGRKYRWLNDEDLVPLPNVIVKMVQLKHQENGRAQAPPLPEVLPEGQRDVMLTSLAGSMRRRGASEEAIMAALMEENERRCVPPLPESQLRKIAKSIARKPPAGYDEHYTDLGNARRFILQHHEDVRNVQVWRRQWLMWDGTRWSPDLTGEIDRLAKGTVRQLYHEAAHLADQDMRDTLLKHAAKSEQASRVRAMLDLAATEPEISMLAESFDTDPTVLNVENGTLDLKSGALKSHRREDHLTKIARVEYDADAKAPRWKRFMSEITAGDEELSEFLQRAIGYSLTGDTREQCLFFCYGQGSNGKSTFLETIRHLMGDYAQQADFTTFLARRGEGPRNDLARMRGARLVTAIEAHGDRNFDETVIKQLTGGDTVVARKLYEEFFEFKPVHKLFLAANHKPIVKEQTEAFWRRIKLIPFTVTFQAANRNKKLERELRRELPGILNWALEGCRLWRRDGLGHPRAVEKATSSYREENDVIGEFFAARCGLDGKAWTATTQLYRVFGEWWLETRGPRVPPYAPGWFGRLLSERADLRPVKQNRTRGWRGVTIVKEIS